MLRKLILILIGTAAIAFVTLPTDVSARGWRGGHGWHGHSSYGWRGYRSYGYPYTYYPTYYPAYYSGYYGCYRNVRAATPYGWVWRRVWVCG